jgi:hypothetical protein
LIALGTIAAIVALVPGALELVAAVLLAAAELVAEDAGELLLLLLPQPTIAAALSSETATESKLLRVRIALL